MDKSLNNYPGANAKYLGFNNGKYRIGFDIGDFEITRANIRGLMIHEGYGHGIMGYRDGFKNHYKAYFAVIDSKYWAETSQLFKKHTVRGMWTYYFKEVGNKAMPEPYQSMYFKYRK
ncbi:hypothetical protein [Pedobacter alpinus]|uniref:Uncharacterized protein n=1 Tax=Pedobacter alpinus TaxID=1590643 RepID=A0ABW5TTH9_9SPHI